ncbi:MAG: TlpA disulfide reductase family protein [Acidimicrobiia bacterium]
MNGRALRWSGLAILAVVVVFAVVLASRFGSDPGLVESPLIGRPAPDFDLPTLDGDEQVALASYRGQVVVVNFFASWCLECRAEHQDLVAASDSFGEDGVQFIQIGYQEEAAASLAYLEQAGTSDATMYLTDPSSRTAIAYGVYGIPETFFIDPDGVVVGKVIGQANALVLGATIDAINRGESPGQTTTGDTQQRPGS